MANDKIVSKHSILTDGPVVTRRAFLGSTIAVSALPALAQNDGSDMEYRLVFNWSANRSILSISQEERRAGYKDVNDVARPPSTWKLLNENAIWRLPKYVFGPNADFRLRDISGQKQSGTDYTGLKAYELTVRRSQFGRIARRDIKFILTAQLATGKTSVFQPQASTRFSIAMSTNVWSLTAGPEKSSYFTLGKWVPSLQNEVEGETTPVLLTAFLSGKDDESGGRTHLTQWVANGRASSSFKAMFNGLLDTRADNTQYGLFIRFTPAGIWHVDTRQSRPNQPVKLTAIDGQVSIECIRFGWFNELSEADRIFSGTVAGTRDELVENSGALAAMCDFADQENEVAQLATPQEFNLRTDPRRTENRALWIRAGYAPAPREGKVTSDQLEAELSWHDAWQLGLKEPNNTLCKMDVWLEGVLRERVALPARQQDLSANTEGLVETRFDANFSDGQGVFSIHTPIGKMNATGAQKLKVNKSEETIQQPDPWTAARIFENRSGSPVRLASAQKVSVADPKNSKTSRAAAELLWFESNIEIQECFQQLAGSDYSRLTFAPTACVLLFAPGEEAPFGHTSFIDLSASEEGSVVALLYLDRARLLAGRGADLVHLTFQFRQLALEYLQHEATDDSKIPPCIVPISQTCRVTRVDAGADANQIANDSRHNVTQNGSSVPFRPRSYAKGHTHDVDTRATLVVEFPPLHMFEETLFKPN